MKKTLLFTLLLCLFISNALAQAFTSAVEANNISNESVAGYDIVATDNGGHFPVGVFHGTTKFESSDGNALTFTSAGEGDAYILKYKTSNQVLQWARVIKGNADEAALAIDHVNGDGEYVVGYFSSSATEFSAQHVEASAGGEDGYVVHYNGSGTVQWVQTFGSEGDDLLNDVKAGGGFVYGVGEYNGDASFDGGITLPEAGSSGDIVIAAWKDDGTPAWQVGLGGSGYDEATRVVVADNKLYVTGRFSSTVNFDPAGGNDGRLTTNGSLDLFLACYSLNDVEEPTLDWVFQIGEFDTEDIRSEGLAFTDGRLILTGAWKGFADFAPFGPFSTFLESTKFEGAYARDGFVASYAAADGGLNWVNSIRSNYGHSAHRAAPIGTDVLVSGYFRGASAFSSSDGVTENLSPADGTIDDADLFILRYDKAGVLKEAIPAGNTGDDGAFSVDVDNSDRYYITGSYFDKITFDDISFAGHTNVDLSFVATFDRNGGSLPIELVSFAGRQENNNITLSWTTALEDAVTGFTIEHHQGDNTWASLDRVPANGTPSSYQWTSDKMDAGSHFFRLKTEEANGTFSYGPVIEVQTELLQSFLLAPAYPNPFNPQTNITLSVAQGQKVQIEVFDLLGRRVATLFKGNLESNSTQTFRFEASNLPGGLYFIRVAGETFTAQQTVTLIK